LLAAILLILGLAAEPLAPSLAVDLDGDGKEETVTAAAGRGAVRLEVRDASGRKRADAKAPAPSGDVVHVVLTAGPIGSAGSLLAVDASTDASECVSIWRFKDRALTRLPVRGADGKDLPDCGSPGAWKYGWDQAADGRPSAFVRERTEPVADGTLRTRETFAFAGFSLDEDERRSSWEINGVPIPSWYRAILYSRPSLDMLYSRFDLSRMRSEPTLSIETDRRRGVFALRFTGPAGELVAPVTSYAAEPGAATLGARVGEKTVSVSVHLTSSGTIPYEVLVQGLGAPLDQSYAPAGTRRGRSRQVYPTAADEVASEDLSGFWDASGTHVTIVIEGTLPYRVRIGPDAYALDATHAKKPIDLLLLPVEGAGKPWGIVLRGPNAIERIPLTCGTDAAAADCQAEGPGQILRRLGARVNIP
jgi:hypothetical protein